MKGKKQPSSNIIEIVTYTYCISASSHDFIICLLPSPPSISFFFTAERSIGLRNKAITKASAASILLEKMTLCPLRGDGSSPPTRGSDGLHSWCTLFMVLGHRLRPRMPLPPSEVLMLLFGCWWGNASLIRCSSEAPRAAGHGRGARWCGKPHSLLSTRSEVPESDAAVDQHQPQVLPAGARLLPGNTARRARHRQEPGVLLAEVLLPRISRTCLEVGRSQPVGSAEPASDLCPVHSSVLGAAQLCFTFSPGISSLPSLSTILPWNHDYRFSFADAFLGDVPLHPTGWPAAWAEGALLGASLMRHPRNLSTKCLLQLPPPLEEVCCVRKLWRLHINALLL